MTAAHKANCPGGAGQDAKQNTVRKTHFIVLHRIKQAIQTIAFTLLVSLPMLSILIVGGAA